MHREFSRVSPGGQTSSQLVSGGTSVPAPHQPEHGAGATGIRASSLTHRQTGGCPITADKGFAASITAVILGLTFCLSALLSGCQTPGATPRDPNPADNKPIPPTPTAPPIPEDTAPFGPSEFRGSWVPGFLLTSNGAAEDIVREARAARLNTLFLQVRARGDAYYRSTTEPQPKRMKGSSADPLDEALRLAGDGLDVHAWINVALVADPDNMPDDPRHIIYRRPEWLSVPLELAKSAPSDPTALREALRRYALDRKSTVEGLYIDLAHPEYAAELARIAEDIVRRYPVRGLHLDYARYPNEKFGYSRGVLARFRAEVDAELSSTEKKDMSRRVAADPLAYVNRYKQRFADFRRRAVNETVRRVADAARRARPGVVVSAAVWPDLNPTREQRFQDWSVWLRSGWIDWACPMIYSKDDATYRRHLNEAVVASGGRPLLAGIGAWQLSVEDIARRIEGNRQAGTAGSVLFSHLQFRELPALKSTLLNRPYTTRSRPPSR